MKSFDKKCSGCNGTGKFFHLGYGEDIGCYACKGIGTIFQTLKTYNVTVFERKSGRHYTLYILSKNSAQAKAIAAEHCEKVIGDTCKIKKIKKYSEKPQVIDYRSEW